MFRLRAIIGETDGCGIDRCLHLLNEAVHHQSSNARWIVKELNNDAKADVEGNRRAPLFSGEFRLTGSLILNHSWKSEAWLHS